MSENEEISKCYVRVFLPGQEAAMRVITYFPCSIGRVDDNDLVIRDQSVSSHHGMLRIGEGGGLYMDDLGSTNGTFCDGVRRERVLVSKPLRLILGNVIMDLSLTEEGLGQLEPPDGAAKNASDESEMPHIKVAPRKTESNASPNKTLMTLDKPEGGKVIICPHCWHSFDVSEFLFIARHQSLIGDSVLGADAPQRFLPSRFTPEGNAIDAAGMSCPDMACPRCHLRIPQAASEMPPLFLSIVGATASGKSYFLTSMTWDLRNTLSRNFAISFTDTDAVNNQILNDFEETIFLSADSEELVALRKTELQGELYNQVLLDNMLINLPKPFMFTVMPAEHHPRYAEVVKSMSRTLVLYDNAGEHFEPGMDSVDNPTTQHLLHSDTIFFLFDPTKDVRFRKRLAGGTDPQLATRAHVQRQEIILTEMINRIKKYSGLKSGHKAAKTMIVLVSKFDVWKHLLDFEIPEEPWQWVPEYNTNALDIDLIKNVSFAVRQLLDSICPEVVTNAEAFAGEVIYLPNSALGHSPEVDANGMVGIHPADVEPFWVSVPMLYFFYESGFIQDVPPNEREQHDITPCTFTKSGDIFFAMLPGQRKPLQIPLTFAGHQLRCPGTDIWFQVPTIDKEN